jgi:uncharacterized membrane protein
LTEAIVTGLLWFAAIASALVAGLFFAFSTVIMQAFGRLAVAEGVAAMQAINRVILRSSFMPLFFGSTLAAVLLAVIALSHWDAPGSTAMLLAGLVYAVGMFLCTAIRNVPLNNRLDAVEAASAEAGEVWARYQREWTAWNHVRTLASTIASALYIAAIALR